MTDEWNDSPHAQYVGVGVDEVDSAELIREARAERDAQMDRASRGDYDSQPCGCPLDGHEPFCDIGVVEHEHDRLSYRLSYWFWLHFYRIKRRLGLM